MPIYRIETNRGTFEVEANREPTADEIMALVEQQGAEQPSAAPQEQPQEAPAPPRSMLSRLASMGNPYGTEAMMRDPSGRADAGGGAMLADMGLEGGGAAAGQVIGAHTGPLAPVAVPALGAIGGGGGNALAQLRRMATGEQDKFRYGEMMGAAGAGAIPGASMAGAGIKKVGVEALKQGGGNLLAMGAQTGIDEGRLPTAVESGLATLGGVGGTAAARGVDQGANAVAREAAYTASEKAPLKRLLKIGRELNFVLPPSMINRESGWHGAVNSMGGKAAFAQRASELNQKATNIAVQKDFGLKRGTELSPATYEMLRKTGPGAVYEEAAATSTAAETILEEFKKVQSEARNLFRQNTNQYDANVLAAAKAKQKEADDWFEMLDDELKANGKPDLGKKLQEARREWARIARAEEATGPAGNIDASYFGRLKERGEELTGNMGKIGEFQQEFARALVEEAKNPPSGSNQLMGMLALPTLGLSLAGPRAVRAVGLSDFYQNHMVNPSYGRNPQDFTAALARMSAQSASRDPMSPGHDGIPEYLRAR